MNKYVKIIHFIHPDERNRCKILVNILILLVLSSRIIASEQTLKKSGSILPWEVITEKISRNTSFVINSEKSENGLSTIININTAFEDPNFNFCYNLEDASEIILLPENPDKIALKEDNVIIEKYVQDNWSQTGGYSVGIQSERILINGVNSEGFYRLSYNNEADIEKTLSLSAYILVCDSWKKDILTFCRFHKNEVETNKDEQLLRSTIAISHFDYCMEIVSESPFLTGKILKTLAGAVENKNKYENGQIPDFAKNINEI